MMNLIAAYALELGILARVALAMLLGAVIGLEREFRDKPAGLRTHMLTTGSAALLVSLGSVVIESFATELGPQIVDSDPLRIIGAVVTGVSFLGAGTILRRGPDRGVEGLTTAASLLLAASVGICVALSQWVAAVGTTALVLIVLRAVSSVERWFAERHRQTGERD
jgi:putative Mg2+ transporter-C (MgtC) family protein